MIHFKNPIWFLLIIPLLIFFYKIYLRQNNALQWIRKNTSVKYIDQFTRYSDSNLIVHIAMLICISLFLLGGIAGPYKKMPTKESIYKGQLIFIIDASASMLAGDTVKHPVTKKKPYDRFAQAQEFCSDTIDLFPDYLFGLITFSNVSVLHFLPVMDGVKAKTAVLGLKGHNFKNPGSNYKKSLRELINAISITKGYTEAVLLSDGEIPSEQPADDITEELDFLKNAGFIVHTVGMGTEAGSGVEFFMHYWNYKDKISDKGKSDTFGLQKKFYRKQVIKSITTKRSDVVLKRIAKATGGEYIIPEKKFPKTGWVKDYQERLKEIRKKNKSTAESLTKEEKEISLYFYIFAFLLFLIDTLIWFGPLRDIFKRKQNLIVLFVFFLPFQNCNIYEAEKFNNRGMDSSNKKLHPDAQIYYQKSSIAGFRDHIPIYNSGVDHLKTGNFKMAHQSFEEAYRKYIHFNEAFYNDGIALYSWGMEYLDKNNCDPIRAKDLLQISDSRFKTVMDNGDKNALLIQNSSLNRDQIQSTIAEIELKKEDACKKEKSQNKPSDDSENSEEEEKRKNSKKQEEEKQRLNGINDKENKKKGNQGETGNLKNDLEEKRQKDLEEIRKKAMDSSNQNSKDSNATNKNEAPGSSKKEKENLEKIKNQMKKGTNEKNPTDKQKAGNGDQPENQNNGNQDETKNTNAKDNPIKDGETDKKDSAKQKDQGLKTKKEHLEFEYTNKMSNENLDFLSKEIKRIEKSSSTKKHFRSRHQQNPDEGKTIKEKEEMLKKVIW